MIIFRALLLLALISVNAQEQEIGGRKSIVLKSQGARVVVDLAGGAIREFSSKSGLNPLSWNTPGPNDSSIHGFGHFLCLDRWGPPSDAEGKLGMPYHGEASNVRWNVESVKDLVCVVSAHLPKAGLSVRRTVSLSPDSAEALMFVREEVTNDNPLGRMFNMVQHPTIAPPFLDESTIVDCNGARGFAQGGTLPNPEEPSTSWPEALQKTGQRVDLRHLTSDPDPNVVSYEIPGALGWVSAVNASKGLMIAYVWRTTDYPWVSLWRDVRDGKPAARGLEFGSTGLHQPFPILAKKGKIWDRPLFEYIDAGEKITKSYLAFVHEVPSDFRGVGSIVVKDGFLHLLENGRSGETRRELIISLGPFATAL